jgi:uncharacterized damage-inducible protein DinB
MKEMLLSLANYHIWANKQILGVVSKLTVQQQQQTINSSFNSIELTVKHLLDAESIWWQRLKLAETIVRPSQDDLLDCNAAIEALLIQSNTWLNWLKAANDTQLNFVFQYNNTKREGFKQPTWQMLLHLFNHATYHRGQLVTLLRQVGVTKIPPTDFIVYTRK